MPFTLFNIVRNRKINKNYQNTLNSVCILKVPSCQATADRAYFKEPRCSYGIVISDESFVQAGNSINRAFCSCLESLAGNARSNTVTDNFFKIICAEYVYERDGGDEREDAVVSNRCPQCEEARNVVFLVAAESLHSRNGCTVQGNFEGPTFFQSGRLKKKSQSSLK